MGPKLQKPKWQGPQAWSKKRILTYEGKKRDIITFFALFSKVSSFFILCWEPIKWPPIDFNGNSEFNKRTFLYSNHMVEWIKFGYWGSTVYEIFLHYQMFPRFKVKFLQSFKSRKRYLKSLIYLQYILNISWIYLEYISNISLIHLQYISNISQIYLQYISNISPIYLQYILNISWICLEYIWNISGTYLQYISNISQIYL